MRLLCTLLLSMIVCLTLSAGEVEIVDAQAELQTSGEYRFSVTLRHADSGWEHYADAWEVSTTDGTLLGRRVLYHPHVNEQPFTRSLSGVKVPRGTSQVVIRARDSKHGYSSKNWTLRFDPKTE